MMMLMRGKGCRAYLYSSRMGGVRPLAPRLLCFAVRWCFGYTVLGGAVVWRARCAMRNRVAARGPWATGGSGVGPVRCGQWSDVGDERQIAVGFDWPRSVESESVSRARNRNFTCETNDTNFYTVQSFTVRRTDRGPLAR